jgi:hypothetical protein
MFNVPRGMPAPGPTFGLGPHLMSDRPFEESPQASQDRRAESRAQATSLGDVSSRLVGGSDLTLLNFTSRSLYGQATSRLLIGSRISVRLATGGLQTVVTGHVVRCSLTELVGGVPRYEVAVALDREVDWAAAKPKDLHVEVDDIDFVPGHGLPTEF